jgi:hypothetical protein
MPTTVSTGLSKKIGLPDYGSLGASCNVTFEIGHDLLDNDLAGFHEKVKRAFVACKQAVQDELYREQQANAAANGNASASNGNGHSSGNGHAARRSGGRRATTSQARALRSIADRQDIDLSTELQNRFGVNEPEELSIVEASQTIDALKGSTNGSSNGRH